MLQILGLLLLSVTHATTSEKLTYEDAYAKAAKEEKVLLVVVGADWCAACKTLKSGTIEPMQKAGKLECVVLAQVDKDLQPELAKQMMNGTSLPQLVAFRRSDSGWKRFSLSGIQSESRVEELIRTAVGEQKKAPESTVVTR
jgi:thioredoxin-like negative regulator of GroEL